MKKILALIAALCIPATALAWPTHGIFTGATGHSWIQGDTITTSSSIDALKSFNLNYISGATPGIWKPDANGYPTADCSGTCAGNIKLSSASGQGVPPGDYYLYFKTGFKTKFSTGTSTNCSLFSGSGGSCSASSNATITIDGTGTGIIKFTLADSQAIFLLNNTFNYSGSTGTMALVSSANKAQYDTYVGTGDAREYYSQAFLTYLANLNISGYRFYGDIGENVNQTLWAYRTPVTNIMWSKANQNYPPGIWSGGVGASGAITRSAVATGCTPTGGSQEVYTALATADQPSPNPLGLLADPTMASRGLQVQGIVPVGATNTTSSAQLCWGTNAYPIYDPATGIAIAAGKIVAPASSAVDQTLMTFVFDPILNSGNGAFLYFGAAQLGGLSTETPYEVQIALVNYLRKNMETTIPYLATNGYVTSLATLVKNTLNASLIWAPEYSNEVWNNNFWPSKYAIGVNFPTSPSVSMGFSQDVHSWYSLRTREIMGTLIPAVFTGTDKARLRRMLGYAAFQSSTVLANSPFYTTRMKSTQLKPGATGQAAGSVGQLFCVYTGGTWGGSSCTGGADYTVQGNRVIDFVEAIAPAPYTGATNLFYGADNCSACFPLASNVAIWQPIINAWETGDTTTSNALIDDDLKQGRNAVQTVTAAGSPSTFTTPSPHGFAVGMNLGFQWTGGTPYASMNPGVQYCVASTPSPTTFTVVAFSGGLTCNTAGTAFSAGAVGTGTVTVGYMGAMSVGSGGSTSSTISSISGTTITTTGTPASLIVGSLVVFNWTTGTGYSNMGNPTNVYCIKTKPTSSTFTVVAATAGMYCDNTGTEFTPGTPGSATVTLALASVGNTVSMMASNNTAYLWGQTLAAQFQPPNETRPVGMSNVIIEQYEDSLEPGVPTPAQCQVAGATSTNPVISFTGDLAATNSPFITNISNADIAKLMKLMTNVSVTAGSGVLPGSTSIVTVFPDRNSVQVSANPSVIGTGNTFQATGNCGTSLNLAVFNYKKTAAFASAQKLHYDQFKGRDVNMPTFNVMSNAGNPSQLVNGGSSNNPNSSILNDNQYGLIDGAFYGTSATFQNYVGIQQFNAN